MKFYVLNANKSKQKSIKTTFDHLEVFCWQLLCKCISVTDYPDLTQKGKLLPPSRIQFPNCVALPCIHMTQTGSDSANAKVTKLDCLV